MKHAPQSATLMRKARDGDEFPGLAIVGEKIATEWQTTIAQISNRQTHGAAKPVDVVTLAIWRAAHAADAAFYQFAAKPAKGSFTIVIEGRMLSQLVDAFYGGTGDATPRRASATNAELHFLARLGDLLAKGVAKGFSHITALVPPPGNVTVEAAGVFTGKPTELIAVQQIELTGPSFHGALIEIAYPVTTLRTFKRLASEPEADQSVAVDPIWRNRISDAVMQVHLPLRTIFARVDVPLTKLLNLAPGDVIPICLPTHVPITIDGHPFAKAIVGEANGRASIRIEKQAEGNLIND